MIALTEPHCSMTGLFWGAPEAASPGWQASGRGLTLLFAGRGLPPVV